MVNIEARYIDSLAITDTGSNIIVGSRDFTLRVLDLEEGIEKYTEKVRGRITSVGINPIRNESRRIVFAVYMTGKPGKIMLYELGDITRKIKTINHKTSREMKGLVFFNNKYIITGGSDAVLSIFNISTGKIVQSVNMGRNNFILSIDLSQRNQLAVGSYTTKLSLYNVIGDKPDFVSRGDGSGGDGSREEKCGLEWQGGKPHSSNHRNAKWDCSGNADPVVIEGNKIYSYAGGKNVD